MCCAFDCGSGGRPGGPITEGMVSVVVPLDKDMK